MSITEQFSQKVWENDGKLPLLFIPNRGQTQKEVHFYGKRSGCGFYFTQEEAMFVFQGNISRTNENPSEPSTDTDPTGHGIALALHFIESNPKAKLEGQKVGTGKVHFLTGNDPEKWITNLPTYHEIIYRELWPGVDLLFQEGNGRLKYLLMVQPGAPISPIRMTYRGADNLSLDDSGNLQIHTQSGVFIDERPISYQEIGGMQVPVKSFFVIEEEENGEKRFGFGIGEDYDPRYPLLIDPGLVYSTYLGASLLDQATRIAVDALGQAYVTGFTNSPNYPTDPILPTDPIQPIYGGGVSDAFITKLTADGSDLVFSTYLGGSGEDRGLGIAVEDGGFAHLTGLTSSLNFPITDDAIFPTYQGGAHDAFYAKISADGSTLLYSTYFGGSGDDIGTGIAVDASGFAYLAGQTDSTDFPDTADAVQGAYQGGAHDAFVAQISSFPVGEEDLFLLYSTYLGGSGDDRAMDVAVQNSINGSFFYVTGGTNSPNFHPTDPIQPGYGGGVSDAFVTKFF
jgi:hypothetical protein